MKNWKKPELLNLMLQETKDVRYGDTHICKRNGNTTEKNCVNKNNKDALDTCASGHGNLQYETHTINNESATFLVSCCS